MGQLNKLIKVMCHATGAWNRTSIGIEAGPVVRIEIYTHPAIRLQAGNSAVFGAVGFDAFGNVNESRLTEIWSGEDYASFRSQVQNIISGGAAALPETCKTCYKAYGL